MNAHVESRLADLPEPVPPATLSTGVMARVARAADRAAPARPPARVAGGRPTAWVTWLPAATGLALVVGIWTGGFTDSGIVTDLTASRLGGSGQSVLSMPPAGPPVVLLAGALMLYLVGLFAPLGGRWGRTGPTGTSSRT